MKKKWALFAILVVFDSGLFCGECAGVSTSAVENVRAKSTLTDSDLRVIDNFVAEAVRELVNLRDFASVAQLRSVVLSMSRSKQAQYIQRFSEAARKHISAGFDQAARLPQDRQMKVRMNLLILIDTLEDTRLLDLALKMLNDKHDVVRYWAVHGVTNAAVVKKLNAGGSTNSQLAGVIAEALTKQVDNSSGEILQLIAQYAGTARIAQAQALMNKVGDARIAKYESWKVQSELVDAEILKLVAQKIVATPGSLGKKDLGRRFGQLYANVFQRYIKGKAVLSVGQQAKLTSVLVEVEDKSLGILLGQPQTAIKRAIERGEDAALAQEYGRLFGDETRAGVLAAKFNIEYTKPGQPKRVSPYALPNPPASLSR